jgi:hypothetical protein
MEMMVTYSWAVLIISIFVAIVFVLVGSASGQPLLPSSCTIQPLLPCTDTLLTNYSSTSGIVFYLTFTNNLQNPILFQNNAFNLTTTGIGVIGNAINYGNCYPSFALIGSAVICKVSIAGSFSPPVGTKANTAFSITYRLCSRNTQAGCPSSSYKSSGYSTQSVAPANVLFYGVSFVANEVNGISKSTIGMNALIYINGVPYATAQNALFVSQGSYSLFGTIPSGFTFSSWTSNNPTSNIPTPNSISSTLNLKTNVTLTLTSTNLACYTCYSTVVASLVCPSTCPKTSSTIKYPNGGSFTCQTNYEGCT